MTADDALAYAGRLPIFPTHGILDGRCTCGRACSSPGKHPLTKNGVLDATTDRAQIEAWWRQWPHANVALATGRLYVVDLDGDEGRAAWDDVTRPYPEARNTRISVTGGGGLHLYYLNPAADLRNTHWRIAPHIDTRGIGGYVLLPPSVHASGHAYSWVQEVTILPVPAWLREIVTPRIATQQQPPRIRYGSTTRYGWGVLRHSIDRVRAAKEGARNSTLNDEAFLIGQYIGGGEIDPRGVAENLEAASADPDRKKVASTIRRALHDGALHPRNAPEKETA